MTNQEAFDGVMKWLTRPDAKRCVSFGDGAQMCVYYDPETENRCAIGGHLDLEIAKRLRDASIGIEGLLTNDDYELGNITSLDLQLVPKIKSFYEGVDVELLDSLQRFHDSEGNWNSAGLSDAGFKNARRIASDFRLEFSF